jgi:hypothetical protein
VRRAEVPQCPKPPFPGFVLYGLMLAAARQPVPFKERAYCRFLQLRRGRGRLLVFTSEERGA